MTEVKAPSAVPNPERASVNVVLLLNRMTPLSGGLS